MVVVAILEIKKLSVPGSFFYFKSFFSKHFSQYRVSLSYRFNHL